MDSKIITKYVYAFSPDNEPVERVNRGETLKFKTLDCFSNQIKSEEQLITAIDFNHVNPATGPVYMEGAEPGDVLVVDILDITIADQGVTTTLPEIGPLFDKVETRTKIIPIKDGKAIFNDIEFPVNTMIGVIGVAPKKGSIPCGHWGFHGGNMDNKRIVKDTKLYFPVNVPGALFQLGDLHATMGDGEICGTGIEIAGEVTVKLDVIKQFPTERPILETEDKWYTIANAVEYADALKLATEDMQKLIVNAYGWDATDAFLYMSVQGDIEICQGCKPSPGDMVVRFGIPKIKNKPLVK